MTSEGDQAALGFDRLSGRLGTVSVRSDEHLLSPNPSKELVRVSLF